MNICVLFYSYFIMFLFQESSGFRKSSVCVCVCVCVCVVEDYVEPLVIVLRIFARSGPKWRQPRDASGCLGVWGSLERVMKEKWRIPRWKDSGVSLEA